MVYQSKFVAVVTHNSKILREFKDINSGDNVKIPFGSEYGLRFKNLNTQRVAISVSIDGVDVLQGSRIVLGANESHDLQGFMNGSAVKNRFKFIQKTKEISDFRGDKIDDGIIRIQYQFQRPVVKQTYIAKTSSWDSRRFLRNNNDTYQTRSIPMGIGSHDHNPSFGITCDSVQPCSFNASTQNVDGITVKGSDTNVSYGTTYLGAMEDTRHVIVMRLVGQTQNHNVVLAAVTTTDKIQCPTCGRKHKFGCKFCPNCGTNMKA